MSMRRPSGVNTGFQKTSSEEFFLILLVVKQSELVFVGEGDKQDQVEDIEDKEQQ